MQNIISYWSDSGNYNQHHLKFFDLTNEIGNYGDYSIYGVALIKNFDEKIERFYLFLDHKATIKMWVLDSNYNIIEEK